AFRTMYHTIQKGLKAGRSMNDMESKMSIVSPHRGQRGEIQKYSYAEAMEMARSMGLLNSEGEINRREFRRFKARRRD
ncbi:MAG TPA: hypothetical protein PKX15_03440, partial [Bacteroidales bacterium]|nr:hypothetical protein [Bacteroidales bacterium]